MISILQAIALGITQGITEWLPVSSSGHLALAQMHLGLKVPIAFDVMLHLATMLVIVVAFRKDIMNILRALYARDFKSPHGRLSLYIVVGSIPTAFIGFLFHDLFESFFYSKAAVGGALIITSLFLFLSHKRPGNKKLKLKHSLLIGIAQGFALIPGISRSGITISTGMLGRVERITVAKFSFLLALPAILGASIFEAKNLVLSDVSYAALFTAMLVSFVVGFISLKFLMKIIVNKKLHLFGYYCLFLGLIILIL